ncbi:Basic-leucine zipper domain [Plasmopara halstedii]|uniref:Basic-leucine zipper domain n=1 Tax=Plasmopara halstedii TaxID=4781 RepID=A0A0P1AI27_PLAHL|nr:Basic-leucine zipper domain [Plasmopara halstedii]CEG40373.1 Basic-leucine zipper domain [Plasmopara halstedii]|eukprot:XP_024576742.1 Basic-leucine zipper domain [Plasmopara halstedii]
MSKKPQCYIWNVEPLTPPTTHSFANKTLAVKKIEVRARNAHAAEADLSVFEHSQPTNDLKLAPLIASTMKINCSTPALIGSIEPSSASISAIAASSLIVNSDAESMEASCSLKREKEKNRRRKREPIMLPPAVEGAKLSFKELRRLKNRVSATRLRQRSQQLLQSMQDQIEYYRARCEFLEMTVTGCATCANLNTVQIDDIELLPASKKARIETVSDSTGYINDDEGILLTDTECVVLHNVLHN